MDRTLTGDISRRGLMAGAALLGLVGPTRAEAPQQAAAPQVDTELQSNPQELTRIIAAFLDGAAPVTRGIALELPPIGDNPAQIPLRAHVTLPLQNGLYCPEMIILAEMNPHPLACRARFTPAMGLADIGTRVRLTQSQHVSAYARLSDGRVLLARQEITVTAGGCGL